MELIAAYFGKVRKPLFCKRCIVNLYFYIKKGVIYEKDVDFVLRSIAFGKGLKASIWRSHDLTKTGEFPSLTGFSSVRLIPCSDEYKLIYYVWPEYVGFLYAGLHKHIYKNMSEIQEDRERLRRSYKLIPTIINPPNY